MTKERLLGIVAIYRKRMEGMQIPKIESKTKGFFSSSYSCFTHMYCMLDDIENLTERGKISEALLLVGFVQGCLVLTRVYAIEEVGKHNSPEEERDSPEEQKAG